MCGRYVSATPPDELAAYFGASVADVLADGGLAPSYNVAPTNDVYAVIEGPAGPVLTVMHWGLVPMWAKDVKIGAKMINARSETLASKAAYKHAFRKQRCLIPADGFYEWKLLEGQLTAKGRPAKQPMYITRLDGEPLAIAGLWERWRDPSDPSADVLHSATIITTSANATMAPIHDRMPVILPASRWHEWLDPQNNDLTVLSGLLVPAPDDLLATTPVSTAVNNVRNKGAELIEPATVADAPEGSGTAPAGGAGASGEATLFD